MKCWFALFNRASPYMRCALSFSQKGRSNTSMLNVVPSYGLAIKPARVEPAKLRGTWSACRRIKAASVSQTSTPKTAASSRNFLSNFTPRTAPLSTLGFELTMAGLITGTWGTPVRATLLPGLRSFLGFRPSGMPLRSPLGMVPLLPSG